MASWKDVFLYAYDAAERMEELSADFAEKRKKRMEEFRTRLKESEERARERLEERRTEREKVREQIRAKVKEHVQEAVKEANIATKDELGELKKIVSDLSEKIDKLAETK
ncbi:MAG: hypothetical protein WA148_02305 [Actinomycetota bacterium]